MRKPSAATAIAITALVVAAAGTGAAATHYAITNKNQIAPKVLAQLHGAQGKRGPKGDSGTNGTNGTPGATGATGATGASGPAGPNIDWAFDATNAPSISATAGWIGVGTTGVPYAGRYGFDGTYEASCTFTGAHFGLPAGTYAGDSVNASWNVLRTGVGNAIAVNLPGGVCGTPIPFSFTTDFLGQPINLLPGDQIYIQARDLTQSAGLTSAYTVHMKATYLPTTLGLGS